MARIRGDAWRSLTRRIGTAVFVLGVLILLAVAALYAYGEYERLLFERQLADLGPVLVLDPPLPTITGATGAPATETPEPTALPTATPSASSTPDLNPTTLPPADTATPVPSPSATATQTPVPPNPQPAQRIMSPAIGLDAPVAESAVVNGQWVVPKFAAGHLQGTAQPGGPGNAVFAGHVSSISSGDVFADIGKLKLGDAITIRTKAGDLLYSVIRSYVVRNDDLTVTQDFGDERATLITCTGVWLPLQRDFSHRLVIVAIRVGPS